jgi:hypothetical protein
LEGSKLVSFGLVYKEVFVTLTHTSSDCKELQFEYKVVMEVLMFRKAFGFDCFDVECVRFVVEGC